MVEDTYLISKLAYAGAQDGVHFETDDVLGVFGDDVAELQPQLVLAFALQRPERVIIHQLCHLARRFTPQPLR